MTLLQQKLLDLDTRIKALNYYPDLWKRTLYEHKVIAFNDLEDAQIVEIANNFWMALPNVRSIRVNPFWLLCEICETELD